MNYSIIIPKQFKECSLKQVLEDFFLIPRKVRHILRTKRHLKVNGQVVHWQTTIHVGDRLDFTFDDEDYTFKTIPLGNPSLVDVLYQDEHLIIVNKPEGMKTHANQPDELALLNHVSAVVGHTCFVVHRLDMETSGAILFAKNPFVLPILNKLLEEKEISREYLALCQGNLAQPLLSYKDKIGRHRHDRRKRVVDPKNGQVAETTVFLKKIIGNLSLINCQLKTGRTHQIRVHLSHHGHAILGDPLYSRVPASRLMLHAHKLTFCHPFTRKTLSVTAVSKSFDTVCKKIEREVR